MKVTDWKILHLTFLAVCLSPVKVATASPENIKPGILYYADGYEVEGNVARIGEERNREEVFKNYNYYEAAYDEQKRIILFRAYRKGDVEWEERYSYHPGGGLASRKTIKPGMPEKLENFPPVKKEKTK